MKAQGGARSDPAPLRSRCRSGIQGGIDVLLQEQLDDITGVWKELVGRGVQPGY